MKRLVVIDAEYATDQRRAVRYQPPHFGRIISRAVVPECPVSLESLEIGSADTPRDAIQLGVVPAMGKVIVVFSSVLKS